MKTYDILNPRLALECEVVKFRKGNQVVLMPLILEPTFISPENVNKIINDFYRTHREVR